MKTYKLTIEFVSTITVEIDAKHLKDLDKKIEEIGAETLHAKSKLIDWEKKYVDEEEKSGSYSIGAPHQRVSN